MGVPFSKALAVILSTIKIVMIGTERFDVMFQEPIGWTVSSTVDIRVTIELQERNHGIRKRERVLGVQALGEARLEQLVDRRIPGVPVKSPGNNLVILMV